MVLKRRFGFLVPNLRGDGAVQMMITLAREFRKRGHAVDLLAIKAKGELDVQIPDGVRVIDMNAPRTVACVPAVVRYLRREQPDALFATEHYSGLPAMYARTLAGTRTPCFIRQDNTWSEDIARASGRHRLFTPFVVRRFFPRARIIAVSQGVADDLLAHVHIPRDRLRVIYNPIIDDVLSGRGNTIPDHPWFQEHTAPIILGVGRLALAKGFDVLIDAFAMLRARRVARLLILGEGPERQALQARINAYSMQADCQLVGFQVNPWSYMAHADVFALSSRFEGLPTVLVEAMWFGTPVVATDCPSGPREILDNGRFGRLVVRGEPDALKCGLLDALQRPHGVSRDLERWLDQFRVDKSISEHLQFVDDVLFARRQMGHC